MLFLQDNIELCYFYRTTLNYVISIGQHWISPSINLYQSVMVAKYFRGYLFEWLAPAITKVLNFLQKSFYTLLWKPNPIRRRVNIPAYPSKCRSVWLCLPKFKGKYQWWQYFASVFISHVILFHCVRQIIKFLSVNFSYIVFEALVYQNAYRYLLVTPSKNCISWWAKWATKKLNLRDCECEKKTEQK